jgi:hypothetical protein
MTRFGDLEAAIMDVMWAAGRPLRVRGVADELNQNRPLAFNTVQTVWRTSSIWAGLILSGSRPVCSALTRGAPAVRHS